MRRWLAVLLCLLIPACALAQSRFAASDLSLNGLTWGSGEAAAIEAMGQPLAVESLLRQERRVDVWTYAAGKLTFTDGALTQAEYTTADWQAPRGLRVGDDAQTVLDAFERVGTGEVLYSAGTLAATGAQLPPCGVYVVQDGTGSIVYQAPVEPYDERMLAEPERYVQLPHATLVFELAQGQVTGIWWQVGALAE
ncbi:MAG: hypothetical protein PHY12_12755 [Eubacteriales bacterium]|nr:hypothetical protein [Eubacteriales bacterium]